MSREMKTWGGETGSEENEGYQMRKGKVREGE